MWCMNSANLKVFFGTLVKSKPGAEMIATTWSSLSFFSLHLHVELGGTPLVGVGPLDRLIQRGHYGGPWDTIRGTTRIAGKDGKVRQVRLPEGVSRLVLSRRGDAGISDPYSPRRKRGDLTQCAVNGMVQTDHQGCRALPAALPASCAWVACDRRRRYVSSGPSDPRSRHIATTSGYLHARPDTASGLPLDPGSSFDQNQDRPMIGSEQSLGMHNEGSHSRPWR